MQSLKEKISWEEYALEIAKVASLRSEDPYRKVGASALNHANMVIGVGYNGLPSGLSVLNSFWLDRDGRRPYMIHAEVNCLSLCKKGEISLLATTLLPCSSCATMIAAYGIKRVVYKEEFERDSGAFEIFKFFNIELIQLV